MGRSSRAKRRRERHPWMELAGCLAGEAEELRRIDAAVAAEFKRVNPDDWR